MLFKWSRAWFFVVHQIPWSVRHALELLMAVNDCEAFMGSAFSLAAVLCVIIIYDSQFIYSCSKCIRPHMQHSYMMAGNFIWKFSYLTFAQREHRAMPLTNVWRLINHLRPHLCAVTPRFSRPLTKITCSEFSEQATKPISRRSCAVSYCSIQTLQLVK